jgi:hypothetical protein
MLANSLNLIHGAFTFAGKTGNQSKPMAEAVKGALEVLISFFEKRKQACCAEGGARRPSDQIVEAEKLLYDQFHRFLQAMETHNFELDMDAGLLMPHLDSWRPLAEPIANAFRAAMHQEFGRSNTGPVARFVATVVPFITDELPSVENVGKHLKSPHAHATRRRIKKGQTKIGLSWDK